jgi:ABC-type branched-subunit amino acid transport system permease subunit
MYVLIGGINSFAGPIIGPALLIVVPEIFRLLKQYAPYISAIILLIVVYAMPEGIAGLPKFIRLWYLEKRKRKMVAHIS